MKTNYLVGKGYFLVLLLIVCGCSSKKISSDTAIKNLPPDKVWEDTSLTIQKRVDFLMQEMTLEEKSSQLLYDSPGIPRLGIPAYNWWNEALHGVARSAPATVFPQTIGLAATFDTALIKNVAGVISDEGRAIFNDRRKKGKGGEQYMGLTFWSPNVNIFRDPRWGRGQETYGEDPYLSGLMGSAFIKGMQGESPHERLKVATCAKHFAVHSGPEGERHGFNALSTQQDLRETYLPAFQQCVDAGVEAVMCAYNRTNDKPCCGSPYLLDQILKQEWGFKGHIVSDCGAISDFKWGHHYTDSTTSSVALALKSGVNLNCGQAYQEIALAIKQGLIDEKLIDERLRPLLLTKFKLGLFDPIGTNPYDDLSIKTLDIDHHQNLALEAAEKSIVLLQNRNNVLPLKKELDFLYMVGPMGGNILSLVGNYNGLSSNMTTIVEGVTEVVSPETRVEYRPGALLNSPNQNPIDWYSVQAKEADATIVMLGFTSMLEGEEGEAIASNRHGDNPNMQLPESQLSLLRKLKNDDKPIIAVICAGSPIDITEVLDVADAVLYAWYSGEAGGKAVANIIFGETSPSGKLPITFPKSIDQLPDFNDYSMAGRTYKYMEENPMFPFGFGLNYGKVNIEDIEVEKNGNDQIHVVAILDNECDFSTEEVLQVYISLDDVEEKVPLASLKSFKRVTLEGHQTKRISFLLSQNDFSYYDKNGQLVFHQGKAKIYVGFHAPLPKAELDKRKIFKYKTSSINLAKIL
ncbi:glycoside hydrolase family 3 protein [Flammeovirga sp. MY04]|uniref:glycoside hydrolase family 3 protein n=1 Tax=Flammeovirga sp. MY04 TaxID=1191459 RepID=UPI000825D233|nr:glycoside hydrolase family 3 protein [Flammeovirga sp. MY04]ANQ52015.2 glycoside hydrolase family 3 protein [Flammeovirga sp. MY04]